MSNLLQFSISEVLSLLEKKEFSTKELVETYINEHSLWDSKESVVDALLGENAKMADKAYARAKELGQKRRNSREHKKHGSSVGKNERAGYNLSQSQRSQNASLETQRGPQTGGGGKDFGFARNKSNPIKSKTYAGSGNKAKRRMDAMKSEAYVVNQADKTGNTKAYQGYKEGKKNQITGEPLYKKGNMKENLVTIEKLNNVSNINVKASDYKSEKDTINEILGAALGGAAGVIGAGTAKGASLLGKAGIKGALAQKAAAGAVGSAAGEMLDPTKKAKDKKPLTAAALGGLGGAVAGGGIGKATDALNKKLGIEATPGQ